MIARLQSLLLLMPLGVLVGCASTPAAVNDPAPAGPVVVGPGTAGDRSQINANNQQVYNEEHAESPDANVAPNQGIP